MTIAKLDAASGLLTEAANGASSEEAADRLERLSERVGNMAAGELDPDHGSLARMQTALDEVQTAASDDIAATIEEARDEIRSYRETIEGV